MQYAASQEFSIAFYDNWYIDRRIDSSLANIRKSFQEYHLVMLLHTSLSLHKALETVIGLLSKIGSL